MTNVEHLHGEQPQHTPSTVERIVENNFFKLAFRFGLLILVPILSWLAMQQFGDIKTGIIETKHDVRATNDAINELKLTSQKITDVVDGTTRQLIDLNASINARFDAEGKRIETQDHKIEKIDDRLRRVEIKVYGGSAP